MDRRESLSGQGVEPILRSETQDTVIEGVDKSAVAKEGVGGEFPMTLPLQRVRAKVRTIVLSGFGNWDLVVSAELDEVCEIRVKTPLSREHCKVRPTEWRSNR